MTAGTGLDPMLPGPASRTTRLPLLLDVFMNVTQILILLVAIATAVISILNHAGPLTVIIRTAVAILAVGLPAFLLNYLVGRFYIQATVKELSPKQEGKEKPEGAGQDGLVSQMQETPTGETSIQA